MKKSGILLLCAILIGGLSLKAATILVGPSYTIQTIQAGLDMANPGDYVLVEQGTYVENIIWPSIDGITCSGHPYYPPTIDGNFNGSVVIFGGGLTSATLLKNFKIINGTGWYAPYLDKYYGGGICMLGAVPASSPTLSGLEIYNNSADVGGGVFVDLDAAPYIYNTKIYNNSAEDYGGGIACGDPNGDGGGEVNLVKVDIYGNTADVGGGIYSFSFYENSYFNTIDRCKFIENESNDGNGGGIYTQRTELAITNCLFQGNVAYMLHGGGSGGAIYINSSEFVCENSTFTQNDAWSGTCVAVNSSHATIESCIFWDNLEYVGVIKISYGSTCTVSYSDVEGGYTGTGNIDSDPWFEAGACSPFELDPYSPCINTGDPSSTLTGDDICGNDRIIDQIIDMGMVESGESGSGGGSIGENPRTKSFVIEETGDVTAFELQNYPNPVSTASTIDYTIPVNTHVLIGIYNSNGQLIKTLVNADQTAGKFSINWDAYGESGNKLTSGLYILKLVTNNHTQNQKIMIK